MRRSTSTSFMQRKPPDSARRRSRDRRRERRDTADRRVVTTSFLGEERRKKERRREENRRADDPQEYYPEEVERIRTNVVQHLKRRRKGPVPRFSCPRCPGFLTVHRPVRWAEMTVFEVTCSGCPRRAVIKETPTDDTGTSWLTGLLRRFFS